MPVPSEVPAEYMARMATFNIFPLIFELLHCAILDKRKYMDVLGTWESKIRNNLSRETVRRPLSPDGDVT